MRDALIRQLSEDGDTWFCLFYFGMQTVDIHCELSSPLPVFMVASRINETSKSM